MARYTGPRKQLPMEAGKGPADKGVMRGAPYLAQLGHGVQGVDRGLR